MWNSAALLSIIAWWSLVATAVFGGLAVITGLIGGVAATRASDIKSIEDAKKIADADARAAEAKAEAAKAQQRAEEARVEAEKVRERLKKSQEMRQLTKPQADAMMHLLKSDLFQKEPKPWIVVSHVSDAEAESFARQLCNFIYSCGARVGPLSEAWQTVPSKTDVAFLVSTNEPTPENHPFACLSHVMQNNGISIGLTIDPTKKPDELGIIVLRKPDLEDDLLVQQG